MIATEILQWRHNLFVAESVRYLLGSNGVVLPSMEPQHTRCGKSQHREHGLCRHTPSMEPQHTRCGNTAAGRFLRRGRRPSMEPQHTCCGKQNYDTFRNYADFDLQWSRNILVAESRRGRRRLEPLRGPSMEPQHTRCGKRSWSLVPANDVSSLQWGHNILVVESAPSILHGRHGSRCFNGATTYSLWKARATSCGSTRRKSFNGATTYSLWKDTCAVTYLCVNASGFNGATTYSLWKVDSLYVLAEHCTSLQWGHNILVVESGAGQLVLVDSLLLQWGHNILVVEST